MPKASRFSLPLATRLHKFSLRLRNRMRQQGINESELAARCARLAKEVFPAEETRPQMSRARVGKILMNCKARPEKSAARVVSQQELMLFALVLQTSIEWLTGQEDSRDPVLWDMLAEPQRSEQLIHLLEEYDEKTPTLLWGESLLCSLTPHDFAHQYHEAHFAEFDVLNLHDEKQKLIAIYDGLGDARRKRIFNPRAKRAHEITQLLFLSELEAIARGTGKYQTIAAKLRRECLENLHRIVADSGNGINLVIAKDADAPDLKIALRDYERLGINGAGFTLWSYHGGKVAWSEHARHTEAHSKLLAQFHTRAAYRTRTSVARLLERLIAQAF